MHAFVQQVLDVPQRKREPDIHHHCRADDFGARLEVAEGDVGQWLECTRTPARLKTHPSDTAPQPPCQAQERSLYQRTNLSPFLDA